MGQHHTVSADEAATQSIDDDVRRDRGLEGMGDFDDRRKFVTDEDTEQALLSQMADLVALEHSLLRSLSEQHSGDRTSLRAELRRAEAELDQCWDLLRQRRALRAAHLDADNASVRSVEQVENYLPHPGGPF